MSTNHPTVPRHLALPAIVGVLVGSAMIVLVGEAFTRCMTPVLPEFYFPTLSEFYLLVQPFHWPMYLACLLWGICLLASPEVRLRDLFLHVGITGNLAVIWLLWGTLTLFLLHHESVQRLIDAPFL